MGGERQGPKGSRYVGGFLQLFDWNAKSRKKLFPTKSDFPDHFKQGKQNEGSFPTTRVRSRVEEDEFSVAVSIKACSDYSCASSVTDEEGYNIKAPGVVARLMGLDCLPTSNALEPYSSPFSDTHSLQETPFRREDLQFSYHDHPMARQGNYPNCIVEPKHQKSRCRPVEKFQTETLPPKSAKSIPITHHKLLSPIKKPGFVSSKDAAHIMEAASKIIEPGPQATTRTKISSGGSSSVPLKVRELKEKMEASQKLSRFAEMSHRTLESNAAKRLKGKSFNKSWNGAVGNNDEGSSSTENKGKSISLAIQAKVNVQRREGMSQKTSEGMKDEDVLRQSQSSKAESSSRKIGHKKPAARSTSMALRQNNQKQNCSLPKESLHSKPLNLHGRKVASGDSSHGRQKILYKDAETLRAGSKKSSLEGRDGHTDGINSGARNVPRKKRSIDGNLQDKRNDSSDSMLLGKNQRLNKSNSAAGNHFPWTEESRKKGTDVVSFTFNTPMTRSMGGLEFSKQMLSSLGHDTGADSLSVLLEKKLRELANGIDSSKCNFIKEESSSPARKNAINFPPGSETARFTSFSSTEPGAPRRRYALQGRETDDCSNTKLENRQLFNFRLPSPVSILDPPSLTESCNSSDSVGSNMTEECKQQEMLESSSLGAIHQLEAEKDLSDSASSFYSSDWELDYIKDILCNVELMFNECVSGRTQDIINPHLFTLLERERVSTNSCRDGIILQERRALFDCVGECLEWRFQLYVRSGFKAWAKGVSMVKRKEVLAEEVHKEIKVWRGMRNCMVDELVDKDMSVQQGRWLDFELDEFELGTEIEDLVVDSLVDEMVADILHFSLRSRKRSAFLLM